jgi:hypothetical protein
LEERVSAPVKKIQITAVGIRSADHTTPLYSLKLALTSTASGGCSVGIVSSRTQAMEFNNSHVRRPLRREDGSVTCIAFTYLSESRRTRYHIQGDSYTTGPMNVLIIPQVMHITAHNYDIIIRGLCSVEWCAHDPASGSTYAARSRTIPKRLVAAHMLQGQGQSRTVSAVRKRQS